MTYAWFIDEDNTEGFDQNPNAGTWGPPDAPDSLVHALYRTEGRRFRMLDDDREICYSGRIITAAPAGSEDDFGPLDDFGTPNAGCTSIEYLEHGKWVML